MITRDTLQFLAKLKQNNNREWFQDHKHLYEAAHKNMIEFADALYEEMQLLDHIVGTSGKKKR